MFLRVSIISVSFLLASLTFASKGLGDTPKAEGKNLSKESEGVKVKNENDGKTPSNSKLTRAAFEAVSKQATVQDITSWAGEPHSDVGSGLHILTYHLTDGTWAYIGTPDMKKVMYIKFQAKEPH